MTKKDYIRIADAFRLSKPKKNEDISVRYQWAHDVITIAEALKRDNSRFDVQRFKDYIKEDVL